MTWVWWCYIYSSKKTIKKHTQALLSCMNNRATKLVEEVEECYSLHYLHLPLRLTATGGVIACDYMPYITLLKTLRSISQVTTDHNEISNYRTICDDLKLMSNPAWPSSQLMNNSTNSTITAIYCMLQNTLHYLHLRILRTTRVIKSQVKGTCTECTVSWWVSKHVRTQEL